MTKNSEVVEALRTLAAGTQNRSETARMKEIIDEVEAALAAGVSREAVRQELNTQGFTMTSKSFESALYRIRKKRVGEKRGQKNLAKNKNMDANLAKPGQLDVGNSTGHPDGVRSKESDAELINTDKIPGFGVQPPKKPNI